jgi:copper transport protein
VRRLLPLLGPLVAAAVLAPSALAHANVVATSPRDGAILESAPTEVRVRFDDSVSVAPGTAVVSNDGGSALGGPPRLATGGRELVLPLRRLGDGDYSVRWRIVSDDGHIETGVLAFRVGPPRLAAGTPRSVLREESTGPRAVDVLSRWLYLGGILVAGGTALFRLLVSAAGRRRWAATLTLALAAVVVGGLLLLHTTHAEATRFGHVTQGAVLVAAGGAVAAALSSVLPGLLGLAVGASLALLAAPSLAGHALDAGRPRPLSFALDVLHVSAAAFWIGGLLQLAIQLRNPSGEDKARRYSKLALAAVAVVALSGGGRALAELTAVSQLWSTGYGRTILVKSALFAALVALGWLSRRRLGSAVRLLRSVSAELALLAVVVGAVAVLTALRPGRDAPAAPPPLVRREVAPPSPPPAGSVLLARESRELAVAIAIRPGRPLRLTATIVGRSGNGVDGLHVELVATDGSRRASDPARRCGHGCYAGTLPLTRPTRLVVNVAGAGSFRSVAFAVAGAWPPRPGTAFLLRATRSFRALRSVAYLERLASGPSESIMTTWKLVAPDRVEYAIRGGAGGIVIGRRRWDRSGPGAPWTPSETEPLSQPFPPWGTRIANVHVLDESRRGMTVSWLDPAVPAWFTGTFDRKTALPIELRMTAAAHFMRHRYLAFDRGVRIEPPPRSKD